jgi:DNA-binding MarR family transcriptional regulator
VQTKTSPTISSERLARELLTLWQSLLRSSERGMFSALEELDISLTQLKALHRLDTTAGELSVKELAEGLSISLAAASRTVEGLLRRGLLERREDEHDRRIKRVRIGADGRDLVRRLNEARLQGLSAWAATLPADQRAALSGALAPILAELPEVCS